MKNTHYSIFLKSGKVNNKGETAIYCKIICFGRTDISFSFGHSIESTRWEKTNKLTAVRITEAERNIRMDIDATIHKMINIIEAWERADKTYTAEMVKLELFKKDENRHKTLLDAFELHKKEFYEDVDAGLKKKQSYKKYRTVETHVKGFLALSGKTDILLDDLTNLFHKQFHKYLQTVKDKHGLKNALETNQVTKYTYLFRHVVERAVENKWLKEYPFINRSLETIDTDPTYLTEEQVRIIWEKEIQVESNEGHQQVKDYCDWAKIECPNNWCGMYLTKYGEAWYIHYLLHTLYLYASPSHVCSLYINPYSPDNHRSLS